eukprot:gene20772-27596_t
MSRRGADVGAGKEWERMNTHDTVYVEQEVMGEQQMCVKASTRNVLFSPCGQNQRKGDFSRAKVKGKKCIELGAGMNNMHGVGTVTVKELDWMKPEQVDNFSPPYDFVLAADCIYHEDIVVHFHKIVMAVTDAKSQVVVVNELRSHSVQNRFLELFSETHVIKKVAHSKMDETYQHENILVFTMKRKRGAALASGEEHTASRKQTELEDGTAQREAERLEIGDVGVGVVEDGGEVVENGVGVVEVGGELVDDGVVEDGVAECHGEADSAGQELAGLSIE